MSNCQFKFKPDKIKFLSNIDTLDSDHKKTMDVIKRKREDVPKKTKRLVKLKSDLVLLDSTISKPINYIILRTKLLDDINGLEENINEVENYEDEIEYYSKTHQILFNYYDIIDGQIPNEIFDSLNTATVIIDKIVESHVQPILTNSTPEIQQDQTNNEWSFDGVEIFGSKSSKLDMLNQLSKLKRKEKKVTRKRVKNVESLIKDNNNIFDYINGNKVNDVDGKQPIIYDRASLYEDYRIILEGHPCKKKINKPCINCDIDKVLIYAEGIYACMKCGEVENCIVESEVTNYKDPMIEKPTFPYKRKNHFCEWMLIYCSLKWILNRSASFNLLQ